MDVVDKKGWPFYSGEEAEAVKQVLLSNKVNYWTGEHCKLFEAEFSRFAEVEYSVALSNGTVALDLALRAIGIATGDEVIVTPRTFIASVSSIVQLGARPIFADVDKESGNITSDTIQSVISHKTKAIICVHLAGWPCDMDEIVDLAKTQNIKVIEDCAQAHGAKYKGRSVGSLGDIGCWSFCQDKIMTTAGEGGMVTTNNEYFFKKMWAYKDHGKSYDLVHQKNHPPGFRWLHDTFGTNYRMTEIQAAIGRIQIKRMPLWNSLRNKNQNTIWEGCKGIKGLRVPRFVGCRSEDNEKKCSVHGAYKCYVYLEDTLKYNWDRERIIDSLNEKGISCFSGSCSEVYLEKAFDEGQLRPAARLPIAKDLGESSLMFLIHPNLTSEDMERTVDCLGSVMSEATH